jgi:hypothetical protein
MKELPSRAEDWLFSHSTASQQWTVLLGPCMIAPWQQHLLSASTAAAAARAVAMGQGPGPGLLSFKRTVIKLLNTRGPQALQGVLFRHTSNVQIESLRKLLTCGRPMICLNHINDVSDQISRQLPQNVPIILEPLAFWLHGEVVFMALTMTCKYRHL